MHDYKEIYAPARRGKMVSKSPPYAWVRTVKVGAGKPISCDPFLLRLKRTNPASIFPKIEDIDQEGQQLVAKYRALQAEHEKLQVELTRELHDLESIESKRVGDHRSRSPRVVKGAPPPHATSCLARNLKRAIWTAEQDRARKSAELQELRESAPCQEYAHLSVVVRTLEAEIAEAQRLRAEQVEALKAEERQKEQSLHECMEEQEENILCLEKLLAKNREKFSQYKDPRQRESKFQKLNDRIAAQNEAIEMIEKRTESIKSCTKLYTKALMVRTHEIESTIRQAFFLYMTIYTHTHKLTPSFFREVLNEAVSQNSIEGFVEMLCFFTGLRLDEKAAHELFEFFTVRTNPTMAFFNFIDYPDLMVNSLQKIRIYCELQGKQVEECYGRVPRGVQLFAFLVEGLENGKNATQLYVQVMSSKTLGCFGDLGLLGQATDSNKASLEFQSDSDFHD